VAEIPRLQKRGERDGRPDAPPSGWLDGGDAVDAGHTGREEQCGGRNGLACQPPQVVTPRPSSPSSRRTSSNHATSTWRSPKPAPNVATHSPSAASSRIRSTTKSAGTGTSSGSAERSTAVLMSSPAYSKSCARRRAPRSDGRIEGPTCREPGTSCACICSMEAVISPAASSPVRSAYATQLK
jgi:hypothetical protein